MGSGLNPSVGGDASPSGTSGDIGAAFRDLSSSLSNALTGPSGPQVLNAIVNAVMGDPQVPARVKQEIKHKVASRWSHVVDLSDSPAGQGPGLGNIPGNTHRPQHQDRSMNNVVMPNPSDNLGIAT